MSNKRFNFKDVSTNEQVMKGIGSFRDEQASLIITGPLINVKEFLFRVREDPNPIEPKETTLTVTGVAVDAKKLVLSNGDMLCGLTALELKSYFAEDGKVMTDYKCEGQFR